MAQLILSRRGDSSYGCNTVPSVGLSVVGRGVHDGRSRGRCFIDYYNGMCNEINPKNESFGAQQLFSHEMIEVLGMITSYELQK